jgi:hypothetical protein
MLDDPADFLSEFGKFIEQPYGPGELLVRSGRIAHDLATGRYVTGNARFGEDCHSIANVNVIGYSHLTGHHHIVASRAGTGDANLAAQQVMLTDLAIVADHHQVVDFGAHANAGRAKSAPVYRAACPHLDIVFEFHPAELGNLHVSPLLRAISKAISPDDGICMNNHAIPQNAFIGNIGMGMQRDIVAQFAEAADNGAWVENGIGTNHGPLAYQGKGTNAYPRGQTCRWMHVGSRAYARTYVRKAAPKLPHHQGKGIKWIGNADDRPAVDRYVSRHNGRGCEAGVPGAQVLLVFDKCDVARLCLGKCPGIRYGYVAIAEEFTPHTLCQGPDGDSHGGPHFPCKPQKPITVSLRKLT